MFGTFVLWFVQILIILLNDKHNLKYSGQAVPHLYSFLQALRGGSLLVTPLLQSLHEGFVLVTPLLQSIHLRIMHHPSGEIP